MNITHLYMGFSRGHSFLPSAIIRKLDDSYINHVYWKFVFENELELIYESHLSGGVQITPIEHLHSALESGKVEDIYEHRMEGTEEQFQAVWNSCVSMHGDAYDEGQILRYYAWIRLFHRKSKRVLRLYDDKKYTCNELIIKSGKEGFSSFEDLDYSYTPERLFQFELHQPSKEFFDEN